jgi:ferric-dicitrate binding protein FerR (iron transport regulator)
MKDYINKVIEWYTCAGAGAAQVTPLLRNAFHQWLADGRFPAEKEWALRHLWNQSGSAPAAEPLASLESLKLKRQFNRAKITRRFTAWKYAAAIAFILALSGAYLFTHYAPQATIFSENFTGYGKSDVLTLPDGSVVHTNSGTLVVYPADFGKSARTLYLSGEACFKVVSNRRMPFVVRSQHLWVTALGTEFKVSAYAEDREAKATLLSGSIRVGVPGNPTDFILKAGEQFAYHKPLKNYSIQQANLHDETAWQRDELVFRGATLAEILTALERKYAIAFQYNTGALGNDKYNFHFQKGASLPEIMEIIQTIAGPFDYIIENGKLKMKPQIQQLNK